MPLGNRTRPHGFQVRMNSRQPSLRLSLVEEVAGGLFLFCRAVMVLPCSTRPIFDGYFALVGNAELSSRIALPFQWTIHWGRLEGADPGSTSRVLPMRWRVTA